MRQQTQHEKAHIAAHGLEIPCGICGGSEAPCGVCGSLEICCGDNGAGLCAAHCVPHPDYRPHDGQTRGQGGGILQRGE